MTRMYSMLCMFLFGVLSVSAIAADEKPAHGLWVWKKPPVVDAPQGAEKLLDFCQSQGVTEVYVSVSANGEVSQQAQLTHLINLLHRSHIRVEALLSSNNADEAGAHREKLLDQVRAILQFNRSHGAEPFDGIHLDIEPQQRPENKGAGNLKFLSGLVEAYRAVRTLAEPTHLTVNADIQKKLLEGTVAQRKMLLSSLPQLTLMLYELSSPKDGESVEKKKEKLQAESRKYLDMAYAGLSDPNLAKMMIGLRTPDYGKLLPGMLSILDETNRTNSHYAGWAEHSYNDYLKAEQ